MNDSIPSISRLDKSVLSQELSHTKAYSVEDVSGVLSNGAKLQEITHLSDLAPIAELSDQIGRSSLKEIPNPGTSQKQFGVQSPPSASIEGTEEENSDFFDDEIIGRYQDVEATTIRQDSVLQKQDSVLQKQDSVLQKQDSVIDNNKQIIAESIEKSNISFLRNQKISPENISRIRDNFAGDLALQFESKKTGSMHRIRALAGGFTTVAEEIFDRSGLQPIGKEFIDQAALRAMALRINATGVEDFTEEDAGKASEKAGKLLRPEMKDRQGKAIDDEQFNLLQEEIKKDFCSHIISLGLIDKKGTESTEKKGTNQTKILNNKEVRIQSTRGREAVNEARKFNEFALKNELKKGKDEVARGWDKINSERDRQERIDEKKHIEELNKKREIKKEQIDKEILDEDIEDHPSQ